MKSIRLTFVATSELQEVDLLVRWMVAQKRECSLPLRCYASAEGIKSDRLEAS